MKPINVIPSESFVGSQLSAMRDPRIFSLMLAAKARCKQAMLRIDYVVFVKKNKMMPSITSKLITVKEMVSNEMNPPGSNYWFSDAGSKMMDPETAYGKRALNKLLKRADFAQLFVPSDYAHG